jgi:hypothetical protein
MKKILSTFLAIIAGLMLSAQGTAGVQVIHNAADPGAATVDIYVNGSLAIDDFMFRTATPFLPLPAGTPISVGVAPGNSTNASQALANFNLGSLTANTNYVVMATGVLDPTQFDQSVNSNIGFDLKILAPFDTVASAFNQVSYRTYHGVTDAPAIDIFNGPWLQLGPLGYGDFFFRNQTVPALQYSLDVRVAGNGPVVTTLDADFRGLQNTAPVVFASGFLNPANNQNGAAIGFFAAFPNGDVVPINMTNPVASVQIVHNAPDPAAALVDIYVNGNLALEDFAFRTATPFINLPANTPLTVGVAPANGAVLANIPLGSLTAGEKYIVMATGVLDPTQFDQTANGAAIGFGLEVFAPAQDGSGSIDTDVLAYHGAPDAPAVDVRVGGNNLFGNLGYASFDGYTTVPAANYVLDVAPAGGNVIASFQADLTGRSGKAGLVFASGFLDPSMNQNGPAFGLFYVGSGGTVIPLPPVPATPPATAKIQVIHNAADPGADTVDIYVNGALAIDDFVFRTATPFIDLPAGPSITVDVAPGNSSSVSQSLATFNLGSLSANTNYVVMATGVLDPTQFDQSVNTNIGFDLKILAPFDTVSSGFNQVSYRTFHGVTDAPAIDIFNGPWLQLGPLGYGDFFFRNQTVPALQYSLDVRVAGNGPVVTTLDADLRGLENTAPIVFASGFLNPANNQNGEALGFYAVFPNGDVVPLNMTAPVASVQIIHNAPDPAAGLVDIYVNGDLALEDFAFRTATPFINLPANTALTVGVAPANGAVIANIPLGSLAAGERYIVMATGVLDPTQFDQTANGTAIGFGLEVFTPAQDASGTVDTDVLAYHGAPDAPAVDVRVGGNNLFGNLGYASFDGYTTVPAANYVLEVAPAGGSPIAAFQADLTGRSGKAGLVFASGFLDPSMNQNGAAFGLFYVGSGGTVIPLPPVALPPMPNMAKVQVIHNSPDPVADSVDIYINGTLALDNFAFRAATPFIDLPSGVVLNVGVAGKNSASADDTLANFPLGPLMADEAYVVVAAGVLDPSQFDQSVNGSDIAFDLKVLANARTVSADGQQVDYMAFHGAPDAPAVDLFNGPWIQLGPLGYGEFYFRYQTQPALQYTLDVKVAGTNTIATTIDADLRGLGGLAPIVFASGFLNPANNQNGPGFGFFAALPDGTVAPLPAAHLRNGVAVKTGITVSPNPAISRVEISLNADLAAQARSMELVDMNGRTLRSKLVDGSLSYGMDLEGLSEGMYMLKIKTDTELVTERIQVIR